MSIDGWLDKEDVVVVVVVVCVGGGGCYLLHLKATNSIMFFKSTQHFSHLRAFAFAVSSTKDNINLQKMHDEPASSLHLMSSNQ